MSSANQEFVIGIEILTGAMRNKNTINGLKVGEKEIKASLYADDTMVFVCSSLKLIEVNCF